MKPGSRRGVAMLIVIVVTSIVLTLGMAMIALTGKTRLASADTRQKLRSRYAAEAVISAAIADAVHQTGEVFGGSVSVSDKAISLAGDRGEADVSYGQNMGQELIQQGALAGLRGYKIPLEIEGAGRSAGGASTRIAADVSLYQVPIFQFGVFYQGNLEITPGPDMFVMGRVHTNSDLYLRGVASVTLQGPITAVGDIVQWKRGTGTVGYRLKPDTNAVFSPALGTSLAAMTAASQPPPIGGKSNALWAQNPLDLPIGGGVPRSILDLRRSTDPAALRRQKYDWIVATRSSAAARFVQGVTARPAWITGPRIFFDRREDRWVKAWTFDVSLLAASANRDSIFFLADTTFSMDQGSGSPDTVINAFRIVNAATLPRNMTIASRNPIYVQGDFNTSLSVAGDSTSYRNAQIASDAITVLSAEWPAWASTTLPHERRSLERNHSTTGSWASSSEAATGYTGNPVSSNVRINAAIITGNKASRASCLTLGTTESAFEGCYEGGWHNTLRFLEDWGSGRTVTMKGSFVCMWEADTRGLRRPTSGRVWSTDYYNPPTRIWGFDPRFTNLNNMPPGTPFLATAILTNWLERR